MNQSQLSTQPGPYNSVFQRDWWLDAVAPGAWSPLEVVSAGEVVARMPIVCRRKSGLKFITMPRLTHTLGPWLADPNCGVAKRLAKEKNWLDTLAEQIPPFDYFCQNWHYSMQNWLPLLWRGFQATSCCTYVIEDISNPDAVWSNYRESARREIRKARKHVDVRTDLSPEILYRMTSKSFGQWNRKPPYGLEYLERLVSACTKRQAGRLFFAEDSQGGVHAALFLVWDESSAYYLVGGSNPESRNSGAMSLLMHEAIQFASTVSTVFDFEGSIVEPIERFVRSFGAQPRPFLTVRGYSRKMQIVQGFREMFRSAAG